MDACLVSVRNNEITAEKTIFAQKAAIKETATKVDAMIAADQLQAAAQKAASQQAAGTAVSAGQAQAGTTATNPPGNPSIAPPAPKKTYYTDGLSGTTTSYTDGCVTKRPGYPDANCDARAGVPSTPAPKEPSTPTHLLSVEPRSNSFTYVCTRNQITIGVPSVWFTISDSRGGLVLTFKYEFNGDSPLLTDGSLVSAQTYTTTSHYEPTAPYLPGSAQYYDNKTNWYMATKPGLEYRVHITGPIDTVSSWRALWYDYTFCTNR